MMPRTALTQPLKVLSMIIPAKAVDINKSKIWMAIFLTDKLLSEEEREPTVAIMLIEN